MFLFWTRYVFLFFVTCVSVKKASMLEVVPTRHIGQSLKTTGIVSFLFATTGPLNMAGGSKLTTKVFFRWHGTTDPWRP